MRVSATDDQFKNIDEVWDVGPSAIKASTVSDREVRIKTRGNVRSGATPSYYASLVCSLALILCGCAAQPERQEQQRRVESTLASSRVYAEHGCNNSEELYSARGYEKQWLCTACKAGRTSILGADGSAIVTCSGCGRADVVIKLSNKRRSSFCTLLAEIKRAEQETRVSQDVQYIIQYEHAEEEYECRAGNEDFCNKIEKKSEAD